MTELITKESQNRLFEIIQEGFYGAYVKDIFFSIKCSFVSNLYEIVQIEMEFSRCNHVDVYVETYEKDPMSDSMFTRGKKEESCMNVNPYEFVFLTLPVFLSKNKLRLTVDRSISKIIKYAK